jgi:urease accessory protein
VATAIVVGRRMMRCLHVLPVGSWNDRDEIDQALMDFDARHRRRLVIATTGGRQVLLDLPEAARLRDGDGLALEGGGVVRICAKPEPLAEISAGEDALVRIAWHLGNRHLPVQFIAGRIRIRADHVIEEMVRGLGGSAERIEAGFDPEPGAYAGAGASHGHHHGD